jgi:uncharacterized membrane protein YdjX (TVP38/TMEM64 family)
MDFTALIESLTNNLLLIFMISILAQIVVAVLGVLPTYFITMANIYFFGVAGGFVVSVIGETIGAIVSFYIYRAGFQKMSQGALEKHDKIKKIVNAERYDAMKLIFVFRLFPYMPSGLVTYGAAIGKVDGISFVIASTLGKVPSLVIEVLISYVFVNILTEGSLNLILALVAGLLMFYVIKKVLNKKEES